MPAFKTIQLAIGLVLALTTSTLGQTLPKGFIVPEAASSPDHRFVVIVPIADLNDPNNKWEADADYLFDTRNGRKLAELQGDTGYDHALNWLEVRPSRWSHDGSLLLWEVSRKWCPGALDLVKINKGAVKWQEDILQAVQREILPRTKQAAPRKYAAAKKENKGSFDPDLDGFIIDVRANDPMTIPLHVEAVLTSDPKTYGKGSRALNSHLEGIVDTKGKFMVTSFRLGVRQWDRF